MLTEFTLDDSLFESAALVSVSANRNFLNLWKDLGILIIGENQTSEDILKNIRTKLSPKVYQYWLDALNYNPKVKVESNWELFSDYKDYNHLKALSSHFKTGVTAEKTCLKLKKLPNYIKYCNQSKFEITDIDDYHNSNNFNNSLVLCSHDIDLGCSNDDIWFSRFYNLAKYSKKIVIIDPYLFISNVEDEKNNRTSSLYYLLNKLKIFNKKYSISIISNGKNESSQSHVEIKNFFDLIHASDLRDAYSKIEIISSTKKYFQEISHDRFINFGDYVCTLGKGLDVLRETNTPQCTLNIVREELSSIRFRVQQSCEAKYFLWKEEYIT